MRQQNRSAEDKAARATALERVIEEVALEEANLHKEPTAEKPRPSKRKNALKTAPRPLRSGEQRITPAEKKSRATTVAAQTDRSMAALVASLASEEPIIEQPGMPAVEQAAGIARDRVAGARDRVAGARGAVARGAGARGAGARVRGAVAREAAGDDSNSQSSEGSESGSASSSEDGSQAGDEAPMVLEGEERNLTWLWDKVRDSSSGGLTSARCRDAVKKFDEVLSSCIAEAEAADNKRKLDLLRSFLRDAQDCVQSLQSGQPGSILLDGAHFSRLTTVHALPAAHGRNAKQPERFRHHRGDD